jgi:cysteine desulfurase
MLPYFTEKYGNASSIYQLGRESHEALVAARETIAEILNAQPSEIVFTGCGSESDNLAIRGTVWADGARGKHIITTPIEHHAVGHTCEQLEREFGCEVTYVPVDEHGVVDPEDVRRAITDETALITIMYANNEIGTIEPIGQIAEIANAHGIPFHTDAVQAGGSLEIDVDELGVDLLSLSAHKFYGPKGVGLLYVREGTELLPMLTGGSQEGGLRAGTENVPYIVGMAEALKLADASREANNLHVRTLRDALIKGVLDAVPGAYLTGHPAHRLPNNASFVFDYVEGEAILLQLDLYGIAASSGSACTTGETEPSHVLKAIGVPMSRAHGSLRFSLGRENTQAQVDKVLDVLPQVITKLQQMSPLYCEPEQESQG